jgi:hypothetical protein
MTQKSWTIAIRPTVGAEPRKITKVVSLKDGGFSVLTPYHQAKSGYLAKMPMPKDVAGPHFRRWSEGVTFTAENRVKLSYHADGFAQFSGESSGKIISGIDPTTGKPKGLGLRSNPLVTPTWRGAVVAITVWGIDDYLTAKDSASGTITFEPDECYYRRCSPAEADGWILTIHAFPRNPPLPIRFRQNFPFLHVASESNPFSPLRYIVEYRLVDFQNAPVFLGLNLNRIVTKVAAKSGWILSGPSEVGGEANAIRYNLSAVYPRLIGQIASDGPLDRDEATLPEEG